MLNSIGLENVGLDAFLADKLPALAARGVKPVVSLSAGSAAEFGEMAERCAGQPLLALELNLSCPNVAEHGANFATDPAATAAIVCAVKARYDDGPIWVKLSSQRHRHRPHRRGRGERGRGRPGRHQHAAGSGHRSRDRPQPLRHEHGGAVGAGDPARRARCGVARGPARVDSRGRHRRRGQRRGRAEVPGRRRRRGATRHGDVRRPGPARPHPDRPGSLPRRAGLRGPGNPQAPVARNPAGASLSRADRVFIALDVPRAAEAEALADALAPLGVGLKMGLELFSAEGPQLARRLAARAPLFLDLKYHDIPATVARAVTAAAGLGTALMNLHVSGGEAMVREAVAARDAVGERCAEAHRRDRAHQPRRRGPARGVGAQRLRRCQRRGRSSGRTGAGLGSGRGRREREGGRGDPRGLRGGLPHRDARHPPRWCRGRRPEARAHARGRPGGRREPPRDRPARDPGRRPRRRLPRDPRRAGRRRLDRP